VSLKFKAQLRGREPTRRTVKRELAPNVRNVSRGEVYAKCGGARAMGFPLSYALSGRASGRGAVVFAVMPFVDRCWCGNPVCGVRPTCLTGQ
jgi:hypothetical protein